jgi:hypothetical protein
MVGNVVNPSTIRRRIGASAPARLVAFPLADKMLGNPSKCTPYAERLEPQPNGDCRRRRHVRPWVSQVPWYYAEGPDVARGFLAPGATKPKSGSRFPKSREARDSRYDKKMRISSAEAISATGLSPLAASSQCGSYELHRFDFRAAVCGNCHISPRQGEGADHANRLAAGLSRCSGSHTVNVVPLSSECTDMDPL